MLKILIVDDHAVVRSGLRQFLADATDFRIVAEAPNGSQALALLDSEDWDLLMLDIGLPDIDGIEVLKRVKRRKPDLPVLIFSMFAEEDYALSALEAGAAGYLPKDSAPEEILAAIHRCGSGERYLSAQLTEKLLDGNSRMGKRKPHEALSEREFEVLRLLGQGKPLIAIADALDLSPKTVSAYRTRVMAKLNLSSNADIARYVLENKLDC